MHFDKDVFHNGNFEISHKDYQKLKSDTTFLKLLSAISFENSAVQIRAKKIAQEIYSLMSLLNEELLLKE